MLASKVFNIGDTVSREDPFGGGGAFSPRVFLAGDPFCQGIFTGSCRVASENVGDCRRLSETPPRLNLGRVV